MDQAFITLQSINLSPAGLPPGGAFLCRPTACAAPGGSAVVNLMAKDTGNSGRGPAQVDLPGSFPGWCSPPRESIPPRGATSQVETLPYGRERYEARRPLVKWLEGMALSCGRDRVRWS